MMDNNTKQTKMSEPRKDAGRPSRNRSGSRSREGLASKNTEGEKTQFCALLLK